MALKAGYVGIKKHTIGKFATRSEQAILGAKNLNATLYTSGTTNGITWTVNEDGSVKADGTATAVSQRGTGFIAPISAQVKVSGCNSGGSGVHLYPFDVTNNARPYKDSSKSERLPSTANLYNGGDLSFYIEEGVTYAIYLRINKDAVVNNFVYYPMIRLASDPDSTYVPFAMTNRELTRGRFEKGVLTSANDLNDITETGIYKIRSAPTNSPENTGYCSLIVNNIDTNQCIQIISKHNVMYQRRKFSPSTGVFEWSSWYKFTGTEVQANKSGGDDNNDVEEPETKTTRSTKKTTTIKEGE